MSDNVRKMLLEKISLYSKDLYVQSQSEEALTERRRRIEDRRSLFTYIAKDRRSGIADRRKYPKKRNGLGCDFDGFLQKPFRIEDLSCMLKNLLVST